MTKLDREIWEATTPGDWEFYEDTGQMWSGSLSLICDKLYPRDARFIAHAHNRWSELLDEIDRLKARNQELVEQLHAQTESDHEEEFGGVTEADLRRFENERRLREWQK